MSRSISLQLGSVDAIGECLSMMDGSVLLQLKAVNSAWRSRARRELCSRVCTPKVQQALVSPDLPAKFDGIMGLNVEMLHALGQQGDVAVALQLLPNLTHLHGWGCQVDVLAVRALDLSGNAPQFARLLRSCLVPQGKAPPQLLLMAVACAASGEVCNVPVQLLREQQGSITELDLSNKRIGSMGGQILAILLSRALISSLKCVLLSVTCSLYITSAHYSVSAP